MKILKWIVAYYVIGLIFINLLSISRFLSSGNILEIAPKIISQNMLNPYFYVESLVWPLILISYLYGLITGQFID